MCKPHACTLFPQEMSKCPPNISNERCQVGSTISCPWTGRMIQSWSMTTSVAVLSWDPALASQLQCPPHSDCIGGSQRYPDISSNNGRHEGVKQCRGYSCHLWELPNGHHREMFSWLHPHQRVHGHSPIIFPNDCWYLGVLVDVWHSQLSKNKYSDRMFIVLPL